MKTIYKTKNYKKKFIENSKMSLLNFNFLMLHNSENVFLKNCLNYLKDCIFKCFLRSIIDF